MGISGLNWSILKSPAKLLTVLESCTEAIKNTAAINTEYVISVAKYRLDVVCANCNLNTDGVCDRNKSGEAIVDFIQPGGAPVHKGTTYYGCGCMLKCKTANLQQACPLGKWLQDTAN